MAVFGERSKLENQIITARIGGREDIYNSPAFREHLKKNHKGVNPFERPPSILEQATSSLAKDEQDSKFEEESIAKKDNSSEKVILYGGAGQKGPGVMYGSKDQDSTKLYGSKDSSSGGDHLTCCNTDFFKDGHTEHHKSTTSSYSSAAPGLASADHNGYVGSSSSSSDSSSIGYGNLAGQNKNMYR